MSEIFDSVHYFPNGMVAAFDNEGKQIPVLQGPLHRVRDILIPAIVAYNPEIHDDYGYIQKLVDQFKRKEWPFT